MARKTTPPSTIVLGEDDEFEHAVADMVRMHREKSKAYGADGDAFNNFYNIAKAEHISPLMASCILGAKHRSVKTEYIKKVRTADFEMRTKYTDDAFLDDAVYAVIDLVLYRRGE